MMGVGREEKFKTSMLRSIVATVIGVSAALCILAFFPHRFFTATWLTNQYFPTSISKVNSSSSCESMETINLLKTQVRQLSEELRVAKQQKHNAPKAGPFGTVKASRTNPTVLPDETLNPKLANMLSNIAINKELIVALANSNVKPMLELWFTSIKRVGISNYLVVALDDETLHLCKSNNVPVYQRDPDEGIDSLGRTGGTFAVSGLKFRILREFLQLGYNVLLSDTDIIYVQNPFDHLYRDSDVETMSDGHDNGSAYGYNDVFYDPVMQWSSYIYTTRFWAYNSGFFYIRATMASIELLDRVADSLARRPGAWDQAVFNEELFFNSRPGYVGLHAAKRTMDIYLFMNSKVLFKIVRKDANLRKLRPVVVHVNYHPDKLPRMKAAYEFYVNGKDDALQPFTDGTPRTK